MRRVPSLERDGMSAMCKIANGATRCVRLPPWQVRNHLLDQEPASPQLRRARAAARRARPSPQLRAARSTATRRCRRWRLPGGVAVGRSSALALVAVALISGCSQVPSRPVTTSTSTTTTSVPHSSPAPLPPVFVVIVPPVTPGDPPIAVTVTPNAPADPAVPQPADPPSAGSPGPAGPAGPPGPPGPAPGGVIGVLGGLLPGVLG